MNQLTAVKTRYPLTYFTWPYRGLRCRPIEVEYFLEVIRWQVTSFQMIADSSLFISNSLPTNVDICSSVIITWSVCYSACAKVLCFTLTNKHGRWAEADVLSSTAFCGRILSAPRKKMEKVEPNRKTDRDLYDVEVIEVDTTAKQLKMHFVDSVTNAMSGVITIMKGITFPSFAWKKCFSARKVCWSHGPVVRSRIFLGGESWGVGSNPGVATSSFFFYFFHRIFTLRLFTVYSHCWLLASRDFCENIYLVLLKRNSINVHCKFGARQKWEPAGRMGDFGHFSTVSLKAHDWSSWILTEGNLSRKFVKYCILSDVCMIHGTVSPQMWCIKGIKGWFTDTQIYCQDFVK